MIVKFYFFWTFWQLFRIKVRQSASDTEPWRLNWLFSRYLKQYTTLIINPHRRTREKPLSTALASCFISNWSDLDSWKCSKRQLCRRPCLVLLDLGPVFLLFSILHLWTPTCLFVTDQWELGLSALGVEHCFDRNKGKFTGKFFKRQNAENIRALVYIRL